MCLKKITKKYDGESDDEYIGYKILKGNTSPVFNHSFDFTDWNVDKNKFDIIGLKIKYSPGFHIYPDLECIYLSDINYIKSKNWGHQIFKVKYRKVIAEGLSLPLYFPQKMVKRYGECVVAKEIKFLYQIDLQGVKHG